MNSDEVLQQRLKMLVRGYEPEVDLVTIIEQGRRSRDRRVALAGIGVAAVCAVAAIGGAFAIGGRHASADTASARAEAPPRVASSPSAATRCALSEDLPASAVRGTAPFPGALPWPALVELPLGDPSVASADAAWDHESGIHHQHVALLYAGPMAPVDIVVVQGLTPGGQARMAILTTSAPLPPGHDHPVGPYVVRADVPVPSAQTAVLLITGTSVGFGTSNVADGDGLAFALGAPGSSVAIRSTRSIEGSEALDPKSTGSRDYWAAHAGATPSDYSVRIWRNGKPFSAYSSTIVLNSSDLTRTERSTPLGCTAPWSRDTRTAPSKAPR